MSRRPLTPAPNATAKGISRMAPGGRLWSESRVRPLWRPVGEGGEGSEVVEPVVLPTDFSYVARGYWDQALTSVPAFDSGMAGTGDLLIGLLLVSGGPNSVSLSAPPGWQTLCSLSSGVGRLCVAGISSYEGTEGNEWGISGLGDTQSSLVNYTWILKGGSGLTVQPAKYTVYPGTGAGSWEQPDPSWPLRIQFVANTGMGGSFPMVPTYDWVGHYVGPAATHFMHPPNFWAYFGGTGKQDVINQMTIVPPLSGSFVLDPTGYATSGFGFETFSVAVGAS